MGGHFSNYNPLANRIPKVIDPETALWITCVTTILNMPVGGLPLPFPVEIKLVVSTVGISNTLLHGFFPETAVTTTYPPIAAIFRQPDQATRSEFNVLKLR